MNIAILIPCYNEEKTIGKVIDDFSRELPNADIFVYDNNSSDSTAEKARSHGATVIKEPRQGKGNVVRSMFMNIDADIYVMCDGDDTYPAESVHELIRPVLSGEVDMCVADRHSSGAYRKKNTRLFHDFGNNLVKNIINVLFASNLKDIMSGYRSFNKTFVKNISIQSVGFEIETEITLHCLDRGFRLKEVPVDYRERPTGSHSKLSTFKDGIKILKTILWIFKDYKPLKFFSILGFMFFVLGLIVGLPVIIEFFETGFVSKVPSSILALGFMLISVLSFFSGFILDTFVKFQRERYYLDLLRYLEKREGKK